jgi:hypothetical protein
MPFEYISGVVTIYEEDVVNVKFSIAQIMETWSEGMLFAFGWKSLLLKDLNLLNFLNLFPLLTCIYVLCYNI